MTPSGSPGSWGLFLWPPSPPRGQLSFRNGSRPMPPLETATYRVDPAPAQQGADCGADALLRRVTANLAHNVNNALAGVISYLELGLREAGPGTEGQRHLAEALRCAWRAAERVRRMVAFARRPEVE